MLRSVCYGSGVGKSDFLVLVQLLQTTSKCILKKLIVHNKSRSTIMFLFSSIFEMVNYKNLTALLKICSKLIDVELGLKSFLLWRLLSSQPRTKTLVNLTLNEYDVQEKTYFLCVFIRAYVF